MIFEFPDIDYKIRLKYLIEQPKRIRFQNEKGRNIVAFV